MEGASEAAVVVRDAYKQFSGVAILRGLNMTVNKGTIYSLLGPSGCGKTTLLSCILGLEHLNSGSIKLSTTKPKEIGYMPQEIGLHLEMTVEETLSLYGTMFGLKKEEIDTKLIHLVQLLELPPLQSILSNISGGQQRRVSLAVSLMHDPQLVILDEPTVGLDPILQHRVWEHLVNWSVDEGKTIIITTHYIEEARRSNRVGLLRGGVLLAEEHPQTLMDRLNCTSMEEAFLKQCLANNYNEDEAPQKTSVPSIFKLCYSSSANSPVNYDEYFKYRRFKSQLLFCYLKTKRTLWMVLLMVCFPIMQSLLFSYTVGRYPADLKIGIYSEELSQNGICFDPSPYYTDSVNDCNISFPVSCDIMDRLRKSTILIEYPDLEAGMKDTKTNHIWGVLHIKANFTPALVDRISFGISTPDRIYDESTINVELDSTNYIIAHYLQKLMIDALADSIKPLMKGCNRSSSAAEIPIKFNKPFYEGDSILTAHDSVPSFLSGFCVYFAMIYSSTIILDEKLGGIQARNRVAGMTFAEVLCSHILFQSVIICLQSTLMFITFYKIVGYTTHGNVYLGMVILFFQGLVGVSFGILFTTITDSSFNIMYAVIGFVLGIFLTTGNAWPTAGLAPVLKAVMPLAPVYRAVDAYRAVIIKGASIFHPDVIWGLSINSVWIVFALSFATLITKAKQIL